MRAASCSESGSLDSTRVISADAASGDGDNQAASAASESVLLELPPPLLSPLLLELPPPLLSPLLLLLGAVVVAAAAAAHAHAMRRSSASAACTAARYRGEGPTGTPPPPPPPPPPEDEDDEEDAEFASVAAAAALPGQKREDGEDEKANGLLDETPAAAGGLTSPEFELGAAGARTLQGCASEATACPTKKTSSFCPLRARRSPSRCRPPPPPPLLSAAEQSMCSSDVNTLNDSMRISSLECRNLPPSAPSEGKRGRVHDEGARAREQHARQPDRPGRQVARTRARAKQTGEQAYIQKEK